MSLVFHGIVTDLKKSFVAAKFVAAKFVAAKLRHWKTQK